MELPETVETINQRLIDHYGLYETGQPKFRVVWSDDEYEKQLTKYTPEGLELPYAVVREVPKYKQYIQSKYLLEKLTPVPEFQSNELLNSKLSYEPLFVFEDGAGNPLPPKWNVIQAVFWAIEQQMRVKKAPYQSGDADNQTTEAIEERAKDMAEALFGNETSVGDGLAHDSAVGYGTRQRNDSKIIIH